MLIISSDTEGVYAEHKKVWSSYMNSNPQIESYFIQYRNGPQEIEGDIFWLNGVESFPAILTKTLDSIEYFLQKDSYDFIVRTNLSSVWNFKVLLEHLNTLPREKVYNGFIGHYGNITFVSGSGIIMTQDVANILIKNREIAQSTKIMDDVDIAYALYTRDVYPSHGKRNDTLTYDEKSYHYRIKSSDRSTEKNTMLEILSYIF
jgi:hypothetical protein